MCGNIKNLRSLQPPVTPVDVDAAVLQYVRKISGVRQPSAGNQQAFTAALGGIAASVNALLAGLVVTPAAERRYRAVDP